MKSKIKFLLPLLIILLDALGSSSQTRQQFQVAAGKAIDAMIQTRLGAQYESIFVIDVDSVLGNAGLYAYPVEDPHRLLRHCFIFIGGRNARNGNFLGVYRDGRILWVSDTTIQGWQPQLFAITDLDRSRRADIMVESDNDYPSSQLWIFSWDGHTGKLINAVDSVGGSVLTSMAHSFALFDAEGDGVIEIRDGNVEDGSKTWSWNGSAYGSWGDTPHLPSTTLWPANKIDISVHCIVRDSADVFRFDYLVYNRPTSLQKVSLLRVRGRCDGVRETSSPIGWHGGYNANRGGDGAYFSFWLSNITGYRKLINPGDMDSGFCTVAVGLPGIVKFDAQGFNAPPDYESMTNSQITEIEKQDETVNSVHGFTIAPVNSPTPSIAIAFLDSLISHKDQSVALGWLSNDRLRERECENTVRGKGWYRNRENGKSRTWKVDDNWDFDRDWNTGIVGVLDKRLEKAKQALMRGDSAKARRELQIFVMEVELVYNLGEGREGRSKKSETRGKKPAMTSEAYALLKYNAEYLIDRLPERYGRRGN